MQVGVYYSRVDPGPLQPPGELPGEEHVGQLALVEGLERGVLPVEEVWVLPRDGAVAVPTTAHSYDAGVWGSSENEVYRLKMMIISRLNRSRKFGNRGFQRTFFVGP